MEKLTCINVSRPLTKPPCGSCAIYFQSGVVFFLNTCQCKLIKNRFKWHKSNSSWREFSFRESFPPSFQDSNFETSTWTPLSWRRILMRLPPVWKSTSYTNKKHPDSTRNLLKLHYKIRIYICLAESQTCDEAFTPLKALDVFVGDCWIPVCLAQLQATPVCGFFWWFQSGKMSENWNLPQTWRLPPIHSKNVIQ